MGKGKDDDHLLQVVARGMNLDPVYQSVAPTLFRWAGELNLSSDEKYRFICMHDGSRKEDYLAGQLRYLEMIRNQELMLGNDYSMN